MHNYNHNPGRTHPRRSEIVQLHRVLARLNDPQSRPAGPSFGAALDLLRGYRLLKC